MTISVAYNKNKSFKITKNGKSITISKNAINSLVKGKNGILTYLKTGKGAEMLNWANNETRMFTRTTDEKKQKLFIVKNTTKITVGKNEFINLLTKANGLIKTDKSPSFQVDQYYPLTSDKRFRIESKDNTFTILDDRNERSITFPLSALETIVKEKKRIFDDLRSGDEFLSQNYWNSNSFFIYTKAFLNFRVLCFEPRFKYGVCIKNFTFQKLVDLLGDFFEEENCDEDQSEDETKEFGEKFRINCTKTVEFSNNKRNFFLTSETRYRKQELKLPIAALDTLLELKTKIFDDLNSKTGAINEQDYINEYWGDDEYVIRTAVYEGEKVLRFHGKHRNLHIISMKEAAFKTLLDIYQKQKMQ